MADTRAMPPAAENLTQGPSTAAAAASPPASLTAAIEAEDADDASQDGYESGTDRSSTASTSLASSIRNYNWENKRRYHKFREGRYLLPNDESEQEREDMKHALVVNICEGSLHSAPLENPQKILDFGTGTGIWAIEMGDLYPEAEITGIDLSPIQTQYVPPNVHFMVDDAEAEWVYPDESVDYIHLRHMAAFVKDWPKLLEQAYRVLKPGGWIELQEICMRVGCDDGTMGPEYGPAKMLDLVNQGMAKWGFKLLDAENHPDRLKGAGFVNRVHDVKKVPIGGWAKDPNLKMSGSYLQAVIYDGVQGITMRALTRGLDWTADEVEVFLVGVRKDLLKSSIHSYAYYHNIIGQKPSVDTKKTS